MRVLDDLISSLRTCFETVPDGRRGANGQYSMADFGMSAFSVFFMQSPSFLSRQRRLEEGHGRSNCQSLFGMGKIPKQTFVGCPTYACFDFLVFAEFYPKTGKATLGNST